MGQQMSGPYCELTTAVAFLLQGASGCRIDFGLAFTNVCKGWSPFPWKLMYLTVQCHIASISYGLARAAEVFRPGCTGGYLIVAMPLVSGLAWYVAFNYYTLLHHNPELTKSIAKDVENHELIFRGRNIGVDQFFRLMNWNHMPYAALGGLTLVTNMHVLSDQLLSISATLRFCIVYGLAYALTLNGIKLWFDFWVYPFLAEMTHIWQHALFYCVSFSLYFAFCLACRALVLADYGLPLWVLEGVLAAVTAAVLFVVAVRDCAARRSASQPEADTDSETEDTDTSTSSGSGPEKTKR